ncbi:MAG: hypothetical protein AAF411_08705 [Myxococcota bacterium]
MRHPLTAFVGFVALLTLGPAPADARCARMALGYEISVRRIASGDAVFVETVHLRPHSARAGGRLPNPLQLQPASGGAPIALQRHAISPRISAYLSPQPLPPGRYHALHLGGSIHVGAPHASAPLVAPHVTRLGLREARAGRSRMRRTLGVRLQTSPPDDAVEIVLEQGAHRWSAPLDGESTAIAVHDFFGRCASQPPGAEPLPDAGTPVSVRFVDRQGRDGPDVVVTVDAATP